MDDERQLRRACQLDLGRERSALNAARRIVIVIVEAALANRHCPGRDVLTYELDVTRGFKPSRIVRVNSGCVTDEAGIFSGYRLGRTSGAEDVPSAASRADADNRFGTAYPGVLDYIAAVAGERFVCEVRVAVDERCATEVFFGHLR